MFYLTKQKKYGTRLVNFHQWFLAFTNRQKHIRYFLSSHQTPNKVDKIYCCQHNNRQNFLLAAMLLHNVVVFTAKVHI